MSQADLTIPGHSAGLMTDRAIFDSHKKAGDVAVHHRGHNDLCRLPGGLRIPAQWHPRLAPPFHSITNVAVMTFILLTSSLTMLLGVRASQAGDKAGAFRWTMITALAGIVFALLHIREWLGLIGEGMTLFKNPWGTGLFGASFFSITGLHLTHVISGVVALLIVGVRYKGGRYNADDIEVSGLYWHFVDLVWMFVVPLVYLLNVAH